MLRARQSFAQHLHFSLSSFLQRIAFEVSSKDAVTSSSPHLYVVGVLIRHKDCKPSLCLRCYHPVADRLAGGCSLLEDRLQARLVW